MKQLTTLLMLMLLPLMASAYDFKVDGIYYNKLSENAVEVTFYKDGSSTYKGNVVIPASVTYEGSDYDVTAIHLRSFSHCKQMTSITLPEGLINIDLCAFEYCTGLQSIQIPNTVTKIGLNAFEFCAGLSSVTLSSGLTEISDYTFMGCSNLTSIVIPDHVRRIGYSAFSGCERLSSIEIPSSVETIGIGAFCGCPELTAVTLPNNLQYISQDTFRDCTKLASINIPSSVSSIDGQAFENCTSLTWTIIPEGVKEIGDNVFYGCTALNSVSLPSSLESIGSFAFGECENIVSITANWQTPPSTLKATNIFNHLYYSANSSAILYIPFGTRENYEAQGWTTDVFKGGIVEIPTIIEFADTNVKAICVANWDTNGDAELDTDEAASVKALGTVFKFNSTITSFDELRYFTGLTEIESETFMDCSGLTSIVIPDNVTTIGNAAFHYCTKLTSLIIPNGVTKIGGSPFYHCTGLTSIVIPASVTEIGNQAFEGCSKLTDLTISEGVTTIKDSAFDGCTSLVEVVLPSSLTNLGGSAFQNCKALKSINIPDGIAEIKGCTFRYCEKLESITIPEGVTKIGWAAFEECYGLTSVTLPSTITAIEDAAFSYCTNLTSVIVGMTVPVVLSDESTFGNNANATLYVPAGCKKVYEAADVWKDFKEIVEMGGEQEEITDISQVENAIYVDKTEVRTGLTSTLDVKVKNALTVAGVSFTLELPEGVTLAKDEDEEIVYELAEERAKASKFSVFSADNGDGTYSFRIMPTSTAVINGNDGTLLTVQLQVPETMEAGDYDLRVTDNRFTVRDADTMRTELLPNVLSTLTVSTIEPGDVNGDNELDLTDAIMIVYYSLNLEQAGFNKAVADVNNDGMIDLTDAIIVVYKSLGVQ